MACIVKSPTERARGVVVFTTQERDGAIRRDPGLREAVEALKSRWVVGLHHNWHDHQFSYDPLFDFSMANEGDLIDVSGRDVPLVALDACNFVPDCFAPSGGDRFWDVLYVARPVFFKGFREFFGCVRALYDAGHSTRVLCICPMPPYVPEDADTVLYEVEDLYRESFSAEERRRFNLITLRHDYPFPLDRETLAHFYRSAKVFVHFAPDERRCRVAGYAWASGLPVVAMEAVGSLLPAELQRPPYLFLAESYADFPELIVHALDAVPADLSAARRHVAAADTRTELRRQLERFGVPADDDGWALDGLDIRLGRHHGIGDGPNTVPMELGRLIELLGEPDGAPRAAVAATPDPELELAGGDAALAGAAAGDRTRGRRRLAWRRRRG